MGLIDKFKETKFELEPLTKKEKLICGVTYSVWASSIIIGGIISYATKDDLGALVFSFFPVGFMTGLLAGAVTHTIYHTEIHTTKSTPKRLTITINPYKD